MDRRTVAQPANDTQLLARFIRVMSLVLVMLLVANVLLTVVAAFDTPEPRPGQPPDEVWDWRPFLILAVAVSVFICLTIAITAWSLSRSMRLWCLPISLAGQVVTFPVVLLAAVFDA